MNDYHIPVLLKEVIELLQVKKGGRYIDCTYGGGGHTRGIEACGGIVLSIDQDPETHAPVHGNFAHLKELALNNGFDQVDGILMDLGVSSHQLETDYRGFSFGRTGNLDMRMDQQNQTVTALDLIKAGSEKELEKIFREFGEENFAGPIARAIKKANVETTDDLAGVILKTRPASLRRGRGKDRTHPATRVFQALRIAVNDELTSLKEALPQAVELLKPGGRLAVISFHSLEDRIVKDFFNNKQKPVTPTKEEVARNPRARSGKLRIYEKALS